MEINECGNNRRKLNESEKVEEHDECLKQLKLKTSIKTVNGIITSIRQVVLFSDNHYIPRTYTLPYTHINVGQCVCVRDIIIVTK